MRLAVGVGVAPAVAGLVGPLAAHLVGAEHLELLLGCQCDAHAACLHLLLECREQVAAPVDALAQQPVLAAQVVLGRGARLGEQRGDVVQPEFQRPVEADLTQPLQVRAE